MKLFLSILLFFIGFNTFSQKVYWASKVVAYSSEYSDAESNSENRAIQALGRPNKVPFGKSACAWQPLIQDNELQDEFLIVSFDTLMPISQIAIVQNYGQGCITKVEVFDEYNNLRPIWTNNNPPSADIGKTLNLTFPLTKYNVRSVKVMLNTARVRGWNQIDAIGISQSETPIRATIRIADGLPKEIIKENLGKNINSPYREISPVISPDGKTLYFTRWEHPQNVGPLKKQDIWYSELQGDKTWGIAKPFSFPINNNEHNALCSISQDGNTIILNNIYLTSEEMTRGVSTSHKTPSGWSFPKALQIQHFNNLSDYDEYSLSPNGRVLILTAKLRNTIGGKDLYATFLNADGTWSEPVNMGMDVNTAEDESAPFIASDGKTMYFSTKGWAGFGDNDIFVSRRLDDTWTRWSAPENLGPNINTSGWDGYFCLSAKGDYAYFSSRENSLGQEDIFRLRVPESIKPQTVIQVTGTVLNVADNKPIAAKINVQSLEDSDTICVNYDPQTGEYKLMLPTKRSYSISASKKGFMAVSERMDIEDEKSYREVKKNLYMLPIESGQKMTLNSVYFEQSKFDLLPNSFNELNQIVTTMKENPSMEILLEGHTDNQGDWNANLLLSKQRVEEVQKYLVRQGISKSRIQIQGFGSTRPLASNNSEEKRKLNRRVEFTIVKK